jgi:hypothetical protein
MEKVCAKDAGRRMIWRQKANKNRLFAKFALKNARTRCQLLTARTGRRKRHRFYLLELEAPHRTLLTRSRTHSFFRTRSSPSSG